MGNYRRVLQRFLVEVLRVEIIFHVAANEEIHISVPVIIAPRGPRPKAPVLIETGFLCNVSEGAVAVVVVEDEAVVAGYNQIKLAIIVVVSPSSRHSHAFETHASLLRNISERAVAIVVIEPVASRRMRKLLWCFRKGASYVHNVKVWIAIIVIVAPCGTRPHVLGQLGRPVTVKVLKMNSGSLGHILELNPGVIFRQNIEWFAARNASASIHQCQRDCAATKYAKNNSEAKVFQIEALVAVFPPTEFP